MSSITTAVQKRDEKPPTLVQLVERMRPEIARALPKHLDADRIARLALTVIRQSELAKAKGITKTSLSECDPNSFLGALITASALGLEPGVNGEAYLVPYGRECQLILGYQGLVKLYFQHPLARYIDAQAVYQNDEFDYAYGLDPFLTHKPASGDRGPVTAYYAVAALSTGAKSFVVLSPDEVKKLRGGRVGPSGKIDDPMRWMERKTTLRQLLKTLPKSTQLVQALDVDDKPGSELSAGKVPDAITAGSVAQLESGEQVDVATGEVLPVEEPPGWES